MELSWPTFNRRSIFSIPEAEEARTVPLGPCDRKSDFGETVIEDVPEQIERTVFIGGRADEGIEVARAL
jgi:hypothetical protein